jgi:DNA relaxase NicK
VINPGEYLANTYSYLEYLFIKQEKIKTRQRAKTINYDRMVKCLRTAAKSLHAMLQVENSDVKTVSERIARESLPKRLAPYAGLLKALNRGDHENVKP